MNARPAFRYALVVDDFQQGGAPGLSSSREEAIAEARDQLLNTLDALQPAAESAMLRVFYEFDAECVSLGLWLWQDGMSQPVWMPGV